MGLSLPLQRLGVFGGAFDPPHLAHLALAQAAIAQLNLDELRVLPTGQAWHKARVPSAAQHRLSMTRLAFADMPNVVVDDREIRRAGPTYTVDTLRELGAENPGAELFLILGEDQARAFTTWHAFDAIAQFAIICVAARAILTNEEATFGTPNSSSSDPMFPHFQPLKMPNMPVSATLIRARIADHQDILPLVGEPVARYIVNHHLFETTR
jgi:nicotinate-nucleotide adenylyltransferase